MRISLLMISILVGVLATVAARAADPPPQDLTAGKKLYTGKCARCHKFYDPARYDDKTWESWMQKMSEKAKLNDEQYRQLTTYLQTVRPRVR